MPDNPLLERTAAAHALLAAERRTRAAVTAQRHQVRRLSTMPDNSLSFFAESVATDTTEYTQDFVVSLIAFGTGDPETGGHSWNFSRSSDDDWGVCTVREIQQATVYGGIESFRLHRSGLECDFGAKTAEETGYRHLKITFMINDRTWRDLVETANIVFRDCSYFTLLEAPQN